MSKFIEKKLSIILLSITSYFLFSISNSLKESTKYNSDLRACARMKAYSNNKEFSKFYEQQAAEISEVNVKFIIEYCKKLTQQNLF